jgi:hypothetical protein
MKKQHSQTAIQPSSIAIHGSSEQHCEKRGGGGGGGGGGRWGVRGKTEVMGKEPAEQQREIKLVKLDMTGDFRAILEGRKRFGRRARW